MTILPWPELNPMLGTLEVSSTSSSTIFFVFLRKVFLGLNSRDTLFGTETLLIRDITIK